MNTSVLSRFFSSAVIYEMSRRGQSSLFRRLFEQINLEDDCLLVKDVFNKSYDALKKSSDRGEYIYKSAIFDKQLLAYHSLNTTNPANTVTMLNEFRTGSCKADIVIVNGRATVYEIKSDKDTLSRLPNQIENYKRVFPEINVIASEKHIESILRMTSEDIGVLCLLKSHEISTEREAAINNNHLCATSILESLRAAEAEDILKSLDMPIPQVPNTRRWSELYKLFNKLDPVDVHTQMVKTLKRTRNLKRFNKIKDKIPESLRIALLTIPLQRINHHNLISALQKPLEEVEAWGR